MLPLFPRLLKFRTALSLSPYQDISESESDTECREGGSGLCSEERARSGDEMLTLETGENVRWNVCWAEQG